MFLFTRLLFFTFLYKLAVTSTVPLDPLSDDFIELINKEGKWKAGRTFPSDMPKEALKKLTGVKLNEPKYVRDLPYVEHDAELIASLPDSFDSRHKWPNCPSLREIRDQGLCGCCWAIAPISAMTDRVCTYSNGAKNFQFSLEDLISCNGYGLGCNGGHPDVSWSEWETEGYVSGGGYQSHEGCLPFSIPGSPHHVASWDDFWPTPACERTCEKGYNVSYEEDKHYGKYAYKLKGEDQIKADVFKNGPVTAVITVYEDFIHYKSGVYRYVKGGPVYGHVFRIIGWGVENGEKYWLGANSWSTNWGEDGYFKFLRGVDECGIETTINAGEPEP